MKLILFILSCICIPFTWTVNHWRVSEDGKFIKGIHFSPYLMVRPGHFVDFFKQGKLVDEWDVATNELTRILDLIRNREKIDDPEIERKIMDSSPFCKKAKAFSVKLENFLTSYAVEQTKEYVAQAKLDVIDDSFWSLTFDDNDNIKNGPKCEKIGYSPYTMDHLPGISMRDELKIGEDPEMYGLCAAIWDSIQQIGGESKQDAFRRYLTQLLNGSEKLAKNPVILIGSVCYWRMVGNAPESANCARTALHYSNFPENRAVVDYTPYAFFTMGNLLQKARFEDDAIILLELAVARSKSYDIIALSHGALGEAYAAAANFTAGTYHFEMGSIYAGEVSLTNVNVDLWKTKESALRCDIMIQMALQNQETNIKQMIAEKNGYNEALAEARKWEGQVRKNAVTDRVRVNTLLAYDHATYGPAKYRNCKGHLNARTLTHVLVCEAPNHSTYEEAIAPTRKKTLRNKRTANNTVWRVAEVWQRERSFDQTLSHFEGMRMDEPSIKPKYPLDQEQLSAVTDRFWRRADWPNARDCSSLLVDEDLFDRNSFIPTFISPENKGFIIADLLTKYLGLDYTDEHPLPWYAPDCGDDDVLQHIDAKGVYAAFAAEPGPKYAENELMSVFVRLTEKRLEMMDVAQRIRTLIEKKIGPQWIAYNLAALYYRVIGNPKEVVKCSMQAMIDDGNFADVSFMQMAQSVLKVTGSGEMAMEILSYLRISDNVEPLIHYSSARFNLLAYRVDQAIVGLKDTLDRDPSFLPAKEDLLRLVCNGKTSKIGVRDLYPPVCCSSVIQNAVCFPFSNVDRCYVVDDESNQLIYARCNGLYTGESYKTHAFANIVSSFLSVFYTGSRRDILSFHVDAGSVQSVEHDELPLDYGGPSAFFVTHDNWWHRAKPMVQYTPPEEPARDDWTEVVAYQQPIIPPKPLSFLWVKDKKEMLKYDIHLPELLPRPLQSQIRKGLQMFPPPRTASSMCSGVAQLSTLLETPVPTWVSVTAKGENLEKYIDVRSPVPSVAGLQPECPEMGDEKGTPAPSPFLAFDHLPIAALSDQFLFYKPEKGLTEALKSLGNERESIEHVAARLHHAMKVSQLVPEMSAGQSGGVHWLLSLVSSLYWRVVGDAPRAVGCLRHSLGNAPPHMRDVALVSLSNVCHQAGLLHSALVTSGAALQQSPHLAAIHVTIANIYASIGDYERALEFYYSTLSLQPNFEPAKVRIRAIYCHSGQTFDFRAN